MNAFRPGDNGLSKNFILASQTVFEIFNALELCGRRRPRLTRRSSILAAFNVDSHVPAKLERQRTCSRIMGMWQ